MLTCKKSYRDIPFAHRQHLHENHCALIHGHNWGITLTFACREADTNGFVVDFGRLKCLKTWIDQHLDHACLFNEDDPETPALLASAGDLFKPYILPNCSCEGVAQHLHGIFDQMVRTETSGRRLPPRVANSLHKSQAAALKSQPMLPIHEQFYTFQGEGAHSGRAAYFIRTFGCPVHCPWCDSAGTWHPDYIPKHIARLEPATLAAEVALTQAEFTVITGGEPAIHDLSCTRWAKRPTSKLAVPFQYAAHWTGSHSAPSVGSCHLPRTSPVPMSLSSSSIVPKQSQNMSRSSASAAQS
jgi:6-pyruvoyltetrahydropterin/6-carboxytetrahydropterin synthase